MTMTPYILNLMIAMCLGALIGAERQWRQRMAGLRTNALVAMGAAVFILSSPWSDRRSSCFRYWISWCWCDHA